MTPKSIERYARHLVLKEIGGAGQNKLLRAKVAIVGAGGLGGPVALYLAAAGVGHITVIDDDHIERSNLQRQIQFKESDLGASKAEVVTQYLLDQNPEITVRAMKQRLTQENANTLLAGQNLIIDGVDNFQTRFDINNASLSLNTPLISGAVGRWDGQVSAFSGQNPNLPDGPCYQCLVPRPASHLVPQSPQATDNCNTLGIVGALVGIVGTVMALEAIKILVGIGLQTSGQTLMGRLWIYQGLEAKSRTLTLPKDPNCPACSKNPNSA